MERNDGVIELHPQAPIPADQAWFWTEAWQEGERRVDDHVAKREVTVSEDVETLVEDLQAVRSPRRSDRRS